MNMADTERKGILGRGKSMWIVRCKCKQSVLDTTSVRWSLARERGLEG